MRFRVAILGMLASIAARLAAQDMPTVLPHDYVLSDILNQQRIEASIGAPIARPGTSARAPARKAAAPAQVLTGYRASPEVSARVRRQFVERIGAETGAANGKLVAAAMQGADPVQNWSQLVASDGLRAGDMADALTGYWLLNWAMANGTEGSRAQVMAVREQVRSMLVASPRQAGLSEAQRQEMSETFMLNFLIQHAAYTDAMKRGDRDMMRRLGDAAAVRFRNEMGVDLRRLRLTDAGFVRAA